MSMRLNHPLQLPRSTYCIAEDKCVTPLFCRLEIQRLKIEHEQETRRSSFFIIPKS